MENTQRIVMLLEAKILIRTLGNIWKSILRGKFNILENET